MAKPTNENPGDISGDGQHDKRDLKIEKDLQTDGEFSEPVTIAVLVCIGVWSRLRVKHFRPSSPFGIRYQVRVDSNHVLGCAFSRDRVPYCTYLEYIHIMLASVAVSP